MGYRSLPMTGQDSTLGVESGNWGAAVNPMFVSWQLLIKGYEIGVIKIIVQPRGLNLGRFDKQKNKMEN